jgi:hypothetical protein
MMPGLIVLMRAPRLPHHTASAMTRSEFARGELMAVSGATPPAPRPANERGVGAAFSRTDAEIPPTAQL